MQTAGKADAMNTLWLRSKYVQFALDLNHSRQFVLCTACVGAAQNAGLLFEA